MNTNNRTLMDWLNYMGNIHVSAIDMGLERVLPVANKLNLIDTAKNKFVFTIAGTNGKGSTSSVIAEICQTAGFKTALYQSPHLLKFNERIKINGQSADDDTLISAFEKVDKARKDCELSLSFFEMTTLAAFLIFAESDCDVWVLEVGLGGRLDVVNIIDPSLAVITNIDIDHVDWLGDDIEKIGFEKAGILRQGIPLVFGDVSMPASVKKRINEMDVVCYQRGHDFDYSSDTTNEYHSSYFSNSSSSATWAYSTSKQTLLLTQPNLSLINASTAVTAILASGLNITNQHINKGLQDVKLIGRYDKRMINGSTWIFDVAHNSAGVLFLLNQLKSDFKMDQEPSSIQFKVIFSMLADKDINQVSTQLAASLPKNTQWLIAPIDKSIVARAASLKKLQTELSDDISHENIQCFDSLSHVVDSMTVTNLDNTEQNTHSQQNTIVLVCGSFHTIQECLVAL